MLRCACRRHGLGGVLGQLTARLFADVDRLLEAEAPDRVLVQDDTTSTMVSALSAFYRHIKIGRSLHL